jgi:hypothetical protein
MAATVTAAASYTITRDTTDSPPRNARYFAS